MRSRSTVTAITQIPALLGTFAVAAGFTVDSSNPDQPIITAVGGGKAFKFKATIGSATAHDLTFDGNGDGVITSLAIARSPIINGASVAASAVTFIGKQTPQPYIGIIVEYGTNLYRHLYIGNMEKLGNYTGGEVITAMTGPIVAVGGTINYKETARMQYPFSGRQTVNAITSAGGVRVVHADNPVPWLRFRATSVNAVTGEAAGGVFGGFNDTINDGYLARGRTLFAGVSILTPINLYMAKPITGDTSFIPLGIPSGVRLINMFDHNPGDSFDIGGETWWAYPAMSRNLTADMPVGTGSWRSAESSYMVGYAYLEG